MIEVEFTPEAFTEYAFEQVRKAASEDPDAARIRILNLRKSIEVAKASFESANTAAIPVVEAKTETKTIEPTDATGPDHGHTAANQSEVEDLNKKIAALEEQLAKLKGKQAPGTPPGIKPEDEENMKAKKPVDEEEMKSKGKVTKSDDDTSWPMDLADNREVEDWGLDPE